MRKRTMSISLPEREMAALEDLSERKGMSKSALIRQAVRLYQSIDLRLEAGEKLILENPVSKEKSEIFVL